MSGDDALSTDVVRTAERLRAGARAMRAAVGPEAIWIPAIAEGLENDAARLDRGEQVDDLDEALELAASFVDEEADRG